MSAPLSRPTPADLFAGRPRPVLTARPAGVAAPSAGAPAPLPAGFAARYVQAIGHASLPPNAKAVARTLAGRADLTGVIPDRLQVGPHSLAGLVGISASACRNSIGTLRRAGWIRKTGETQAHVRRIELVIPDGGRPPR